MNTVLILYSSHDADENIPFTDLKYQRCYEVLYQLAEERGIHLCRAALDWYDRDNSKFLRAWEFRHGRWNYTSLPKPNLILDRTRSNSWSDLRREDILHSFPFIDDPEFTAFINDKYTTSKILPQYFKPYMEIVTQKDWEQFLQHFPGQHFVIKPRQGSGGRDVKILSVKEAENFTPSFPIIAQEFIDSSHGITGITNTFHDLRIVIIGNEIIYSYIRTPQPGSFLANIAQGGTMTIVPKEKLPTVLSPLITDVQKHLQPYREAIYTIDCLFDEQGRPWIVELNSMPGMFFPEEARDTMIYTYQKLIDFFIRVLESQESQ